MMNAAFELVYEPCRRAYEGAVGKRRACVRACEGRACWVLGDDDVAGARELLENGAVSR